MTEPNAADPSTASVTVNATPAGAPSGQPDYKAMYEELLAKQTPAQPTPAPGTGNDQEDWKGRAIGFQRLAQEKENRAKELAAQISDLSTKVVTFAQVIGAREAELADLKLKEAELDVTKGSLERVTIIASEYPELLPFLSKEEDLLPDGSGDELRTKLSKFQEKLGIVAAPQVTKKPAEGATPPPPTGSGGDGTYGSLMQEALNALSRGDQATYDQFYQKAIAASR